MRKKQIFSFLATAMLCCCAMFMQTSCVGEDNPASPINPTTFAQLKQGVWTEYDEALLTSGKYTEEQLAAMPAVGMMIEGDRGYFFTYTAEDISDPVEGKISYNKSTGEGIITFPAIKDSPLSGQKVVFSMTSDETMQFEFTYEGQKTTGTCAWLCENLDNWNTEITDADWKELMAYYELIAEDAGPDASIDWSDSEVKGLDEPLVWDEGATASARTRAIGIGTVVSMGLKVLGSLLEEDPNEKINAKLDAVLGKVDGVLANQQQMMAKLNEINGRLIAIAQKMKQTETVNIFNNRNEKYYNKLNVQNSQYFDEAFQKYKADKNDTELGDYAKEWVGKNEEYLNLTWEYIEYLTTVQHTDYGTGMDRIYDGLTYDKYPWEHIGIDDRLSYRAYDMFMITKCLFMISLYSTYGKLSNIRQKALYKMYDKYKPQLKKFCEFTVANPDEFRVCQIPGAHFVMHKEVQKYNYCGKKNKAPDLRDRNSAYRPEWHEAGSIKIDNPKSLREKLIRHAEATAIRKYYESLYNKEKIWWYEMLVEGGEKAAGAVYSKKPSGVKNNQPSLMVYLHDRPQNNGILDIMGADFSWLWQNSAPAHMKMGHIQGGVLSDYWWDNYYSEMEYYAAIVEKRY